MSGKRREWEIKEVLITAKAYPNPSANYRETCCFAGITSDGKWIRLWPILYRDLPLKKRPDKYDVIRLRAYKHPNDARPETYFPDNESILKIDEISPRNNWTGRKTWIWPMLSESMCSIIRENKTTGQSLGGFRPKKVIELVSQYDPKPWTDAEIRMMAQLNLFGERKTILEKIPFVFKYKYECADPECKGHEQTIIDWEIAANYRKIKRTHGGDKEAIILDIKKKWLGQLCNPAKETVFFVGDMRKYPGSFVVLGVCWPRKESSGQGHQTRLL